MGPMGPMRHRSPWLPRSTQGAGSHGPRTGALRGGYTASPTPEKFRPERNYASRNRIPEGSIPSPDAARPESRSSANALAKPATPATAIPCGASGPKGST